MFSLWKNFCKNVYNYILGTTIFKFHSFCLHLVYDEMNLYVNVFVSQMKVRVFNEHYCTLIIWMNNNHIFLFLTQAHK
jgi:hypothetical protein